MQTQKQKGGTVHEKMGIFVRTFILTLAYLVSNKRPIFILSSDKGNSFEISG